jgi:hypothetical protein
MGRQVTSFGTEAVVNVTLTSNTTINAGERVFADASSGAFTITLPASPNVGDTVQIIDVAGIFSTNNVTIARNSEKIQNLAEDLTLNLNNAAITMIYSGETYGWVFVGP